MSASYLDHFGLFREPFGLAPEPEMFHASPGHQRVLEWIEDEVAARRPVLSLTGAGGTGKTTLLWLLPDSHAGDWTTGLIAALHGSGEDILVQARRAFGLPDKGSSPAAVSDQIRRFAEGNRRDGRFTVLIVDDAHMLDVENISALAALTHDGAGGGLLTLLLAGRPELHRLLAAPRLRGLHIAESAGARMVVPPFGEVETADYVTHRLAQAGADGPIFDNGAMQMLHLFGLGVPRLINMMADHCLRVAATEGLTRLDGDWVGGELHEASSRGMLSHLTGQPTAAPLPPASRPAAKPRGTLPETEMRPAETSPAAAPDASPPLDLTEPDIALGPLTTAAASADQPMTRHRVPVGRSSRGSPPGRADALRPLPEAASPAAPGQIAAIYIPVDPAPLSSRRGAGTRLGLWLGAAVVLISGASFVWLQRGVTPAPPAADPSPPAVAAPVEQAAAPRPPAPAIPAPAAAPSVEQAQALEPVEITLEPTVTALMQEALEAETRDPAKAAIAYARAAIRGRDRAAYYLGQLHETGLDGVPNLALARLWYAAADELPAAQRRLQALSSDTPGGPLALPVPVFHARLGNGFSEMIWTLGEGAAPVGFRVEMFGPAEAALPAEETTVPGLIVPFPVSAWRVVAIGANGGESPPSATVRMIDTGH